MRETAALRERLEATAERATEAERSLKGARSLHAFHVQQRTAAEAETALLREGLAREGAEADAAIDELAARLDRALRGCARWRAEAAAQARLILDQQRQLDHLLEMDTPDVDAGVLWQQRRADLATGYGRIAS